VLSPELIGVSDFCKEEFMLTVMLAKPWMFVEAAVELKASLLVLLNVFRVLDMN
jgi:hypothetical protein